FVKATIASSAALALLFVVLAGPLITVFFGEAYLPSLRATQILMAAAVVLSANRVIAALLKAINVPLAAGLAELAGLAITLVCLSLLLPMLGIVGASVTSVVAYVMSMMLMLRFAGRR